MEIKKNWKLNAKVSKDEYISMYKKSIDEIIQIANETAFSTAKMAAKVEGLPIGISSGAALAAGIEVAQRKEMKNKKIIIVIPSFAERYLSTPLFN